MSLPHHRLRQLAGASVLGAGLFLVPAPSPAMTVVPALQSVSGGSLGGDPAFSGSLGYGFSLSRSILVSALGFFDAAGDGLLSPHAVGLFDAGSQALLASATVPAGSDAWLQDGFRWVGIPGLQLLPGSYVIAATTPGDPAGFDPVLFESSDPTGLVGFVMGTASFSVAGSGSTVAFPSLDEGVGYGFIGPNLAVPGAPGPLPLVGAGAAFGWSRRLRSRLRRASRHHR